MATPRKNGNMVICIRSVNDRPQSRRPFAFNHRAKVLQMPQALARTDRDHIRRTPVESNLFNTDRLAWALRGLGLDREQYKAMLTVRDSFSSGSLAIPSGMDPALRGGLEREHLARPIVHGGRTVMWQLTMAGAALLEAVDTLLTPTPPPTPPKPDHRAVALQRPRAVGKRAA